VKVKQHSMRTLPSDYETIGGVGDALDEIVTYHRPDNYIQTLKQRIDGQKDADVEAAARQIIEPDGLTWVVVGDRKRIEQPIRDLKIGEIHFLDADGNVVK
jgi:zinc protease